MPFPSGSATHTLRWPLIVRGLFRIDTRNLEATKRLTKAGGSCVIFYQTVVIRSQRLLSCM